MTGDSIALAVNEAGKSRNSAENTKELKELLQAYRDQNRILSECNVKLEKALEALTEPANKLGTRASNWFFDASKDAVILFNAKGTIIDAEKHSVELFGNPKKRMIGRSVSSLFAIDQRRYLAKNLRAAGLQHNTRFELKLQKKDGSLIYLDINTEQVDREKGLFRFTARDVTNFVKTREQLLRNRVMSSLGEMMAGIAHEVNNPLGVILLYSELLLKNNDPVQTQKDLKIIHGEAKRAVRILSALLTYTRRTDLRLRKVDLHRIVRGTLRIHRYSHKVANISDKVALAQGPLYVAGNVPQLTQVFTNIFLNAEEVLKKRGGGTISVTSRVDKGRAVVSIADDGTGILPEHLDKIFYPFFTTKETEGTGFGLSTCYGIITALNGLIYAENIETGGAIFTIELPLWRRGEKIRS